MHPFVEKSFRIFGGGILCLFALTPAWIGFHILAELTNPTQHQTLPLLLALAFCILLAYFLLLIAYRALTGRGRKPDGGLLPPWAMLPIVVTFAIFAVAIAGFGFYSGNLRAVGGGVAYLGAAIAGFRTVRARQNKRRNQA